MKREIKIKKVIFTLALVGVLFSNVVCTEKTVLTPKDKEWIGKPDSCHLYAEIAKIAMNCYQNKIGTKEEWLAAFIDENGNVTMPTDYKIVGSAYDWSIKINEKDKQKAISDYHAKIFKECMALFE